METTPDTSSERKLGRLRKARGHGGLRPLCPETRRTFAQLVVLFIVSVLLCGCTSLEEYVHNGFKVGPNYRKPPAAVAAQWIDAADVRVRSQSDDLSKWWTVFDDPALNSLVCYAYRQNLPLRVAGFRVLEARAQLGIDIGLLFPQTQTATGDYTRTAESQQTVFGKFFQQRFFSQWDASFNLSWELDFWGRFRRAVESDAATLSASVENFDDVLVTLLSDVATNYVQMRTAQLRIKYAEDNVALETETLNITKARLKAGTVTELDVAQAKSTLEATQALIPELKITLRIATNQLCILLGIPPEDLEAKLGLGPVPVAPPEVAIGIPADLLRRRPDVRRAERQAAAQCAQIGVAESDFYPHIAINGTLGYAAQDFQDLFRANALQATIGPSFQWNILNYGRILNNVRLQDAKFQELVATYQNTVLTANQEAENGIVTFLRAQERTKYQAASVADAQNAVRIGLRQYKAGTIDFTRVTQLEQDLVPLEDTLAQAEGEIATGLIQVYRALGGGWQIRVTGCDVSGAPANGTIAQENMLPQPRAVPGTASNLTTLGAPLPAEQGQSGTSRSRYGPRGGSQ
jgi:NodT family efflux transporter outer membrane factor (OMF) lipoprotein